MPKYRVTFSEVSIREMEILDSSPEDILEAYNNREDWIIDCIDSSVEVDGHYEKDILIVQISE
jgi:hypothetical protein